MHHQMISIKQHIRFDQYHFGSNFLFSLNFFFNKLCFIRVYVCVININNTKVIYARTTFVGYATKIEQREQNSHRLQMIRPMKIKYLL